MIDDIAPPTSRSGVVWVTGAAGGIGRAICEAWLAAGAVVVATDVRACLSRERLIGLACDVTSRSSIDAIVTECERLGGVDVLVNCAGVMRRVDAVEMSARDWDAVFDVNLKGAFLCSQAAARSMIKRGKAGSIIHVGSINAEKVFADTVAYCSSKGALHSLGRSMALALAPHRIRVNIVAPGSIHDTDLEPERWAREESRAEAIDRTPLRALGVSADVAGSVVFLGSDESKFITGATLFVDGGRQASV
jgi:NAD(P)-dependent dehydrogenase (short-subunit alcohol dehydrogenase family)